MYQAPSRCLEMNNAEEDLAPHLDYVRKQTTTVLVYGMEYRRPTALVAKQLQLAEKSISVESHEVILRMLIEAVMLLLQNDVEILQRSLTDLACGDSLIVDPRGPAAP
jgi:hypothetical protein